MVCLGFEPGAKGYKAHMKPRNYGGRPITTKFTQIWWLWLVDWLINLLFIKNGPYLSFRLLNN